MKLFWKLFCSMVTLTALACSIGGYLLIDFQFRTSLEREVEAVYEENDLLRYTLAQELERQIENLSAVNLEELTSALQELIFPAGWGDACLQICDSDGVQLLGQGDFPTDAAGLHEQLSQTERGWVLTQTSDGELLCASSPISIYGRTLYLENCREISSIFSDRDAQYRSFLLVLLALTGAVGLVSLGVTSWMLRPLRRLSVATRRIAAGELSQRVTVSSTDELGQLSADFNAMAAQLETQVQQLQQAQRRQEDFIGSFAHEIKTPLTSIIGYADLLRSRPATAQQVQQSAGYIFREGRRLEALSRKLMELMVLDRQDFPLQLVPMDAFLRRVGGALRPALESQGIGLKIRARAATIPLEPDLMETVCLNLLDNARKAMDGSGTIYLEGLHQPDGYCIRVTDNGKGIPAGELARITEAFYMVDKSRSRAQGGAGLGLAICQRIVDLHGGRIQFQSLEGRGTQVCVYLKGGGET